MCENVYIHTRARVYACVRACMGACMCACARVCVNLYNIIYHFEFVLHDEIIIFSNETTEMVISEKNFFQTISLSTLIK